MVLACSHFQGERQDQPAVDRDRLMKPAGLACNHLVCQTHHREVVCFQYSAPNSRDRASICTLSVCLRSQKAEAWWLCDWERGHWYGTLFIPKSSPYPKIRCWEGRKFALAWKQSSAGFRVVHLQEVREFVRSGVAVMDVARTHSSSLNCDELMSYCGLFLEISLKVLFWQARICFQSSCI